MAFWNRKKEDPALVRTTYFDIDGKDAFEKTFRNSTETQEKSTAALIKSNNELIKALNNATREFRKSK